MPVRKRTVGSRAVGGPAALVAELAAELRSPRPFGQPFVEIDTFPRSGLTAVTVIWDALRGLTDEQRSAAVLDAYQQVHPNVGADRVAFALGYTTAEATAAGKLPYAVRPTLAAEPTLDRAAVAAVVREYGGADDRRAAFPALRFPTREDAEACRQKLLDRLPGTEAVWTIAETVSPDDAAFL
ncbi:MAG TPA: hypothetical protein VD866_29700 [Urbifossiella sp.]|nr:hypothetical protein [Urbifossiella sp.]